MIHACEKCNFRCSKIYDFNKHLLTAKHNRVHNNEKKNASNHACEKCNFTCSNKYDYNKHLLTAKHNRIQENAEKASLEKKMYICDTCSQQYKFHSGLWKHKKTCKYIEHIQNTNTNTIDATSVVMLLKQNQEFKNLMLEQYTQLQDVNKQNIVLQHQLVDAVKNNTNSITNVTNNTTHNHQKFNLNFFLNDTCKDAMSITDFLRNMNVHIDELEYIGNHGYVNGMTKMIMDRLKDMDITKRPIHCTDIKRETMYIKDDAGWSKDTDELTKLRKILSRISMNNYRTVPDWRTAHPDCEVMESRSYDFCYKMMRAILGDVEEEQIRLDNKIIKTMAKELFVQK